MSAFLVRTGHAVRASSHLEVHFHKARFAVCAAVAAHREGPASAPPAVERPFDRAEQRALAGAVRADHGDEPVDVEVEI